MGFFAPALAVAFTFVLAIVPAGSLPGGAPTDQPVYPAAPGYLLPWAGGEIHDVTQGEETSFTHNGASAYAFDFNLNYDTVVAARSGKVVAVRDNSNTGGCDPKYAQTANYVVIDHGDGTAALYLHLAYASASVAAGDLVEQGQPIAVSGETGVTCSEDEHWPAPHLHFQVQPSDGPGYMAQSLPVTFDDVGSDGGVPQEGKAYASGNYGPGKEQKLKLTPRRVPRVFAPKATPADPALLEAAPEANETVVAPVDETATPTPTETPSPEPTETDTPTPEPSHTPTSVATSILLPVDTPTAMPTDTPAADPSPTPTIDAATAEPTPAP